MQHGWPVFSSIAVERIALNELYDRWLLTCWAPPCFRFCFMELVKLWDWNSRLFQQITWRSSAIFSVAPCYLVLMKRLRISAYFHLMGKALGIFFTAMKGVSDTIWESTGIQTSIFLNPDSYISFTGCHCQFTESIFFGITYHFNDVVKTVEYLLPLVLKTLLVWVRQILNNVIIHH